MIYLTIWSILAFFVFGALTEGAARGAVATAPLEAEAATAALARTGFAGRFVPETAAVSLPVAS